MVNVINYFFMDGPPTQPWMDGIYIYIYIYMYVCMYIYIYMYGIYMGYIWDIYGIYMYIHGIYIGCWPGGAGPGSARFARVLRPTSTSTTTSRSIDRSIDRSFVRSID